MSFDELGLRAELLRAVSAQGYDTPTPIQARAIPRILEGQDIMAAAQTGTGKTAGFILPVLQRLMDGRPARGPAVRALVLVPTRELAAQVADSAAAYGRYLPLRSAVVFGGVGMKQQVDALRRGADVLVATPGRLLDHVRGGTADLSRVETLVLDEADRMLDMGFIHDIRRVLARLPAQRQNLLFSATFAAEVKSLAARLLDDPALIEAARPNTAADTVVQEAYRVDRGRKAELLVELIHRGGWSQVLVFTRTRHGADRLARKLSRAGISAAAIHGNKSQTARTRALAGFKAGKVRTLVATEIAARGLDIDGLPHVVNYELPHVAEDYVHRIGRTGRAGASGHAVSLVCVDEDGLLTDIERVLGHRLRTETMAGFEPDPAIRPAPLRKGGQGRAAAPRRAPAPGRRRTRRRRAA